MNVSDIEQHFLAGKLSWNAGGIYSILVSSYICFCVQLSNMFDLILLAYFDLCKIYHSTVYRNFSCNEFKWLYFYYLHSFKCFAWKDILARFVKANQVLDVSALDIDIWSISLLIWVVLKSNELFYFRDCKTTIVSLEKVWIWIMLDQYTSCSKTRTLVAN